MIHIMVDILHITLVSDLDLALEVHGMAVMAALVGAEALAGVVMADSMILSSLHGVTAVTMAAFGADMVAFTEVITVDGAVMDTVAFGAADTIATV